MAVNLPPLPPAVEPFSGPQWQKWVKTLVNKVTSPGALSWSSIDFTGSKLTDIVIRNHNDLTAIQGGAVGDYQHLTTAQLSVVNSTNVLIWLNM